jgi:hypothetical protein
MPIGVRAAKRGLPPIPAFGIGWLYPVCPQGDWEGHSGFVRRWSAGAGCTVLKSIAQGLAGLVPTEWNRSQVSGWPWRKILPDAGLLAVLAALSSWLIRR